MTAAGPAFKAGGPSNLLRKSVPPPPLRGACGGPDNRPGDRLRIFVLDQGDIDLEVLMTMISTIEAAARDAFPALIAGLEAQFGCSGCGDIAAYFLEAEAADFYWESRVEERHLGAWEGDEGDDLELDRVAIIGRLQGDWFTAISIVDGDGAVHRLHDLKRRACMTEAVNAFSRLR